MDANVTTRTTDRSSLICPADRRAILDAKLTQLLGQGFQLSTRFSHHAVLSSPTTGRLELFIDEYGNLCWD